MEFYISVYSIAFHSAVSLDLLSLLNHSMKHCQTNWRHINSKTTLTNWTRRLLGEVSSTHKLLQFYFVIIAFSGAIYFHFVLKLPTVPCSILPFTGMVTAKTKRVGRSFAWFFVIRISWEAPVQCIACMHQSMMDDN